MNDHITQDSLRGFVCRCGGRFDAPMRADALAVARVAHAWTDLHRDCGRMVALVHTPLAVTIAAKVRP